MLHYRYERGGPDVWTNVAVRNAFLRQRPLIYLYGVSPGRYEPVFPCYVVGDRPADETFEISAAPLGVSVLSFDAVSPQTEIAREYATVAVKVRLHQRRFRELVVSAYRNRCTVCSLGHRELLDGAHILEDRDERGRPEIANGLALCKIHHGAYDANILGITPDYGIVIREDILEEQDGPMLRHGLQEMHGQSITVPRDASLRPRGDYLEERFERFQAA